MPRENVVNNWPAGTYQRILRGRNHDHQPGAGTRWKVSPRGLCYLLENDEISCIDRLGGSNHQTIKVIRCPECDMLVLSISTSD